ANFLRLRALLREGRRQLRPLEKQAEAARRHGDLVAELQTLRRHLAGRELSSLEARLASIARSRVELTSADHETRAALSRLDTDVMAAETALSAATAGRGVDEESD